jgi:hypothetical protein
MAISTAEDSARTTSAAAFSGGGWCQADLLELQHVERGYYRVVESCFVIRFVDGKREIRSFRRCLSLSAGG